MSENNHKKRVLIVDDELQILSSLEDLLEDDFDEIYTTTDAEEALRILATTEISVILSDQRMPGMQGDEFLSRARNQSEATRVLITGYADHNALVRAVNSGQIYGYVAKPWDPMGLKVTVQNAAKQYNLIQKLSHEQMLLQTLMDNIPDSIYFKDAACRFTRINSAEARVLSIDHTQDAIGKTYQDYFPEEMVLDTLEMEQRIIQTGESAVDKVVKLTKSNGTNRWFSMSKVAIKNKRQEIVGLVGINRDITERVDTERQLLSLIDNHPDGVGLLNEKHQLILANPKCYDYLGLLSSAKEGEPLQHLGDMHIADLLRPRSGGLPYEIVYSDGEKDRTFEIGIYPIKDMAAPRWILAVRDDTIARETQARVQSQYHLASVGRLAAGIAHDFNNMLTVMMGTAQILEIYDDVPDRIKENLRTIYEQGQRASQLVRQILDFSRNTYVEKQTLDIVPFMKEAVKLMQQTLPEIKIELKLEVDKGVLSTNLTHLQQIVTNLAVNARDAMPNGGTLQFGVSHLQLKEGDAALFSMLTPGAWLVWTVSDTGVGIPPKVLKHIYEPFFTTKAPNTGTGLGLSQVYGIVKQHDGFVNVTSTVGEGTTFTIYFPLVKDNIKDAEITDTQLPYGHGETIFLIEDRIEVLNMTQSMLKNLNYHVISTDAEEEVLSLFETHQDEIALVLTDWIIAEWRGLDLAKAFKEKKPQVGIVVMSGYAIEKGETSPQFQEIDGWLEKPLSLSRVAHLIDDVLAKKR
jgi:two-component system cell cycle sensor histidine kinase/response regulator CckA